MENIWKYLLIFLTVIILFFVTNELISGNREAKYETQYWEAMDKIDSIKVELTQKMVEREYIIRDVNMYKRLCNQSKMKLAEYSQDHANNINRQEEALREATPEEFDSLQNEYFNNLPEE